MNDRRKKKLIVFLRASIKRINKIFIVGVDLRSHILSIQRWISCLVGSMRCPVVVQWIYQRCCWLRMVLMKLKDEYHNVYEEEVNVVNINTFLSLVKVVNIVLSWVWWWKERKKTMSMSVILRYVNQKVMEYVVVWYLFSFFWRECWE